MNKLKLGLMATMLFAGMPCVSAIHVSEIEYPESNVEVTESGSIYELKLTDDAIQDIIIQQGEEVILDLNGFTLTNYTDQCEAIRVLQGGKLTVVDKSDEKDGKVTQKDSSTYSVITNEGTLIIEGGNFETTKDFYVIRNEGTLTINGGNYKTTSNRTSLMGNIKAQAEGAKISVNGGSFESVLASIKNYSENTLEINEGKFVSSTTSAITNLGDVVINGGEITSNGTSAITLATEKGIMPTLTINNGKITSTGDSDINADAIDNDLSKIVITGGDFSKDISSYLSDDKEIVKNEDGTYTVKTKVVENSNTEVKDNEADHNPKTSDNLINYVVITTLGIVGLAILSKKILVK